MDRLPKKLNLTIEIGFNTHVVLLIFKIKTTRTQKYYVIFLQSVTTYVRGFNIHKYIKVNIVFTQKNTVKPVYSGNRCEPNKLDFVQRSSVQ